MAQDVIYPGEGTVFTREKVEIHCFGVKCHIDINMSNWSIVLFKVCVSLLIFCLVDLSIVVNGVLKSPTIIVLFLVPLSYLLAFVLHIAVLLCWVHIYLQLLYILLGLIL